MKNFTTEQASAVLEALKDGQELASEELAQILADPISKVRPRRIDIAQTEFDNITAAIRIMEAEDVNEGELPALPKPFFYYMANADESVEWNEGCVCIDDVYTNAEHAAENETHGGRVYSEAQIIAYGEACASAALSAPAAPAEQKRLTPKEVSEQIARDAIDGAILKGRMNVDPPPSPDHWLNEFWQIGRQLAEYGKTGVDNVNPPDDADMPAAPPAAPAGWALVPKEPTGVMKDVGSFSGLPMGVAAPHVAANVYRAMIAAAPAPEVPAGWISIKDRLPDLLHRDDQLVKIGERIIPPATNSDKVLVVLSGGGIRVDQAVQLDGGETTIWCTYGERVTHWMPLPAAPEVAE